MNHHKFLSAGRLSGFQFEIWLLGLRRRQGLLCFRQESRQAELEKDNAEGELDICLYLQVCTRCGYPGHNVQFTPTLLSSQYLPSHLLPCDLGCMAVDVCVWLVWFPASRISVYQPYGHKAWPWKLSYLYSALMSSLFAVKAQDTTAL